MIKSTTSVIIPLYNTENFISEAVESLLNQSLKIDQIIIVNDGSTDSSLKTIKKYCTVEVFNKENSGVVDSLNLGISKATGDLIGFLDADDRWSPNKHEVQRDILLKNDSVDFVFGTAINFKWNEKTEQEEIVKTINSRGFISGMYRKTVFQRVGILTTNPKLNYVMEWHDRAQQNNIKALNHPEIIYHRRIHSANTGILNKEKHHLEYLNTIKASLEHRRANTHN